MAFSEPVLKTPTPGERTGAAAFAAAKLALVELLNLFSFLGYEFVNCARKTPD